MIFNEYSYFCYIQANQPTFYSQPAQAQWPQQQAIHQQTACQQQYPSILDQAISLVQDAIPAAYAANMDVTMAEMEAFVNSTAEDLMDNSSIDDDYSSISGASSCASPTSDSSSVGTDDSEWTTSVDSSPKSLAVSKRKPRTNRRSVEDRRSRKKEQNKNAANRYRMKKKAEIEILLDEESDLIKRNESLMVTYTETCREAKYLKSLLRELITAQGIEIK